MNREPTPELSPGRALALACLVLALLACKQFQQGNDSAPEPTAVPVLPPVPVTDPASPDTSSCVPVGSQDTSSGSPSALVTLVEFTDLQCPFCARAQTTLDELRTSYPSSDLRIVIKHNPLPFHAQARDAALAAQVVQQASGSDTALKFMSLVLTNRAELPTTDYTDWVRDAGGNVANFGLARTSATVRAKVDADMAAAQRLNARGTPTFFVNGKRMTGARSVDEFKTAIDSELEAARFLVTKGLRPEQVYTTRCSPNLALSP